MTLFPLSRILSKAFLRPSGLPETAVARMILVGKGIEESWGTRYHRLRTGKASWLDKGCGNLPLGVDELRYWATPWAVKIRKPIGRWELFLRWWRYPVLFDQFFSIVQATKKSKAWVGPPAKGIVLTRGSESLFILTDGHHRLGALAAVFTGREHAKNVNVPAEVSSEWDFQRTVKEGYLSENDRRQWWGHVWGRIAS